MRCPYCFKQAKLKLASEHYATNRVEGFVWVCECGAMVGCHKGTQKPLGRLANRELRLWKRKAHAMFDQLWKTGRMTRKEAYRWLSFSTGIPLKDCHIGMMDVEECRKVVEAITSKRP